MITRLAEETQTQYAELLELLMALDRERHWSHLDGSFTTVTVDGDECIYFQYSDADSKSCLMSVGPKTAALEAMIGEQGPRHRAHQSDLATVERLAKLLAAAGMHLLPHAVDRVLAALANGWMFRLGCVLIGSHAFALTGAALGVAWPEAAIDPAGHLQIGTPFITARVPNLLESLQTGFVPTPRLDARQVSTSFRVRGKELRVDLLTPERDGEEEPVFIPRFSAIAAPVKHLSLLIDDAQPALAVSPSAAVLIQIPTPARLALHKLLVSQTRSLAQQTKSAKDLHQAALLLEVLAADRPADLEDTGKAFARSGPAVTQKVLRALATVEQRWPCAAAGAAIARPALQG